MCLVGDLLASGQTPNFKKALASHTQALQLADTLVSDEHPAVRMAAKQVLVDAHLGAAHDIAWGEWKEKPKAVTRWLDRAITAANDLVDNEGDTQNCYSASTRGPWPPMWACAAGSIPNRPQGPLSRWAKRSSPTPAIRDTRPSCSAS